MTCFLAGVSVTMNTDNNGLQQKPLRRKAKKLSKGTGIGYMAALDIIARENGYPNWKKLYAGEKKTALSIPMIVRPVAPVPASIDYHDLRTGVVIGKRPNVRMSVKRHGKVGDILQQLLGETEYHKRAKKHIRDIRIMLDTWLGYEYDENAFSNVEFNQLYYSNSIMIRQNLPTRKEQESFKRLLRRARAILNTAYHDCKPLEQIYSKFDLAMKALDKWPASAKAPVAGHDIIQAGTFVRVKFNKKVGLVFLSNARTGIIEGYTDGGGFTAGHHEVTVLRKQPSIDDFKPMRLCLPYGVWMCTDGSEVLFNRDYSPMWRRSADGVVQPLSPDTIIDYEDSDHFYNDRTAPYYDGNMETIKSCRLVLQEWGILDVVPEVLKRLPDALLNRNYGLLSPKGIS